MRLHNAPSPRSSGEDLTHRLSRALRAHADQGVQALAHVFAAERNHQWLAWRYARHGFTVRHHADFWLNAQFACDLYEAQQMIGAEVGETRPLTVPA